MERRSKIKLMSEKKKSLASHEVVTLAVYLLGGETKRVDTEDVAVKANELAPGRFAWKKYRDQINIELIRVYLSVAKKSSMGRYLVGSGNTGWMLSQRGLEFARARASRLAGQDLSRPALDTKTQGWIRRERARLLTDDAHQQFVQRGVDGVSRQQAEAFFRLDAYVTGKARQTKILRVLNVFNDDPELGATVRALASKIQEPTNGN
ncbi:MAG: hypothetical protein HY047_14670 [Acidobacteria bacterium]|nr:hypothetical protein [Acidobacteriota bacterium]